MISKNSRKFVWWVLVVLWAGLIFWFSSFPDGQGDFWFIQAIPYGDKLAHACAFGVLGIFLYLATKRWWLVIAIVSLYGISDEFHQSFVSGRSVDSTDWIADTVGAVLAVTVVKFLTRDKNS